MPLPVVKVKRGEGKVTAEMISGKGKRAGYVIRLWDPELTTTLYEEPGRTDDDTPDTHDFRKTGDQVDGCMVQSITNVLLEKKDKDYYVAMLIKQDGRLLPDGTIEESGKGKGNLVRVHLRAVLEVV